MKNPLKDIPERLYPGTIYVYRSNPMGVLEVHMIVSTTIVLHNHRHELKLVVAVVDWTGFKIRTFIVRTLDFDMWYQSDWWFKVNDSATAQ